jgi:hypothetical protein
MIDNTLTVEQRHNYGSVAFYPVCDKAKALASITNTTTLTSKVLSQVNALGLKVVVVAVNPVVFS